MFRAVPLHIIRSFPLHIRHWYMSCRFDDIYQCRMYSGKLLIMGRGTDKNELGKLMGLLVLLKRNCLVVMVIRLRTGLRSVASIPIGGGGRVFSRNVRSGSETHPACNSVGTPGSFLGIMWPALDATQFNIEEA